MAADGPEEPLLLDEVLDPLPELEPDPEPEPEPEPELELELESEPELVESAPDEEVEDTAEVAVSGAIPEPEVAAPVVEAVESGAVVTPTVWVLVPVDVVAVVPEDATELVAGAVSWSRFRSQLPALLHE